MDRAIFVELGLETRLPGSRCQPPGNSTYCEADREDDEDRGFYGH
jgi:hypothetical protein